LLPTQAMSGSGGTESDRDVMEILEAFDITGFAHWGAGLRLGSVGTPLSLVTSGRVPGRYRCS
jgi:hypothetical protein